MKVQTITEVESAVNLYDEDYIPLPVGSIGHVISGNKRSKQITVSFPKCQVWILLKGQYKFLEN